MEIYEKDLNFSFNARYFDNGVKKENTKAIWFVFHGYGQLAFYFIKNFSSLTEKGIRVIAPEGLSRFYLNETKGRIGATWMTSEDRERDIRNYTSYFSSLYADITSEIESNTPITLFGFSQGAATACRCAMSPEISFSRIILWAGLFPHDMNQHLGKMAFANREIHFVYGTEDPYLSDERFAEQDRLSSLIGVKPIVHTFKGVHTIDKETLESLV